MAINPAKRQAEHIKERHEHRGVQEEAERRAWATVNKETQGGKKSGSGRGTEENSGRLGGAAAAKGPAEERARSAKKAAQTRKRRAG